MAVMAMALFARASLSQAPQGPQLAPPRTFPAPTNLKVLPEDLSGQQVHDIMEHWAGSLGTQCDSCHAEDQENAAPDGHPRLNFADDSKPMKAVARLMYRMTEEINNNYIPKGRGSDIPVTCGTCHRGRVSPEPFTIQAPSGQRTTHVQKAGEETPQPTGEAKPDGHQPLQQVSSKFVDGAACETCHKEVVRDFANNPHSGPVPMHEGKSVTCESCHGPGTAHAEGGALTMIFNPVTATAKEVDEKCQACHGSKHASFERSVHGDGGVSCIGCHVIHASAAPKYLLKMEQPQLCFQCHSDVKPQFSMPVHHKVEEELIECTDCHDAHGAFGENMLPSARWQFIVCIKCHLPAAGPFIYEHAAVKAEGCIGCHFPHGGPNPHLLIQENVNTICLQCHLPSSNSTAGLPDVPAHILSAQSPSCISCHSSIHGSNTSEVFLRPTQGKSER
ncbi:Cytochrome c family protein (modular protein) [Candidatus Sulfotelmatomonas gaucii]|uniref:Photosynthetic reaction center cytochrome c subunit n=1 Tax=Candidatus Sulfuritelmatomonas gaucii TaxID=2043161 RepID=A0A2N9L713_9BACT|nr:Cytochrome c family protein (modular protein) [Candidatus Sulfotelmatomonas gaucii]